MRLTSESLTELLVALLRFPWGEKKTNLDVFKTDVCASKQREKV